MINAVKMAKEAAGRVLHDKVYAEARYRHLNDATQSGFDHHLVRVAGEHAVAIAFAALEHAREPVAWMYEHPDKECGGTEIWPDRHEYGEGWTETPLYVSHTRNQND